MKKSLFAITLVTATLLIGADPSIATAATEKTMTEKTKDTYEDFKASMERNLDKVDEKISELTDKSKDASKDAKKKMERQVDSLKKERKDLARDLDRLGDTSKDKYEEMKASVQKKYYELEAKVQGYF